MTLEEKAKECRREVLTLIHKAQTSHIASNFSAIDIATAINEYQKPEDVLIWSKGWAAATAYYFLWKQGKITREQLETFPKPPFIGLTERDVPGIVTSGGSMGHGLPVGVGMAFGKKRSNEAGKVYVIMSDGEMNEGTTWESAAFAAHHKLDNLVVIIDVNKWQAMGKTEDVLDYQPLRRKWRSFMFETREIDGNVMHQCVDALTYPKHSKKPLAVVCNTIKGKGVSFFENSLIFHYKHVTPEDYEKAMKELV